eukprot:gb/GEZN01003286.1/.p1 GENE.gb/GEZN01003286.1/~~gb/GEZN01003286.1/.p1  ORF type:complete len:585 (+),score=65.34 gb/GEZN01003286.1/:42-1796(+)
MFVPLLLSVATAALWPSAEKSIGEAALQEADPLRFIVVLDKELFPLPSAKPMLLELLSKFEAQHIMDIPLVNGIVAIGSRVPTMSTVAGVLIVERDAPRWISDDKRREVFKEGKRKEIINEIIDEIVDEMDLQSTPWGISQTKSLMVPDAETAISHLCIIDSGYDMGHEDLWGADRVTGAEGNNWNTDGCSHGTHVAGTITAVNNKIGVVGVTQNAPLYIVKVFGDNCGWTYASNLINAMDNCARKGQAKVISMSLGCASMWESRCKSQSEEWSTKNLLEQGVLLVAAAGNSGNNWRSYPASHPAVMSVAASGEDQSIAKFSQHNDAVEITAPGVSIESTVRSGSGFRSFTQVKGVEIRPGVAMEGSAKGTIDAELVNCGFGTTKCADAKGRICLVQRGFETFATKTDNCDRSGGIGCIIYNNQPGDFSGMLSDRVDHDLVVVSLNQEDGVKLVDMIVAGEHPVARVSNIVYDYEHWDGTSMATPHVSAAALKIWSHFPTATVHQVREALIGGAFQPSAVDEPGHRNNLYGWGIMDVLASYKNLSKTMGMDPAGLAGGSEGRRSDDSRVAPGATKPPLRELSII